ncbi:hypothetical protein MLD38_012147 [Melastoma candidum]|uniref:Uncharacterized protein n=1 Tax=Melastoma candidum TaxID=119954 RepID=A0ACB9R4Z6_9MYRT|nr:hypothetical protein MLD38_012147 [Melastoma candidum]
MASTLVIAIVFLLDVVAFSLAVAAEQRRNHASRVNDPASNSSYCRYDSDVATGLGVISFLFLLASQLLAMVVTRCLCCCKALRPSSSRTWAIVLFITCWVFFIIAEICLLAGSVRNAYHTKPTLLPNPSPSCAMLRKGIFGTGAAFIDFTGIVSFLFSLSHSKAKDTPAPYARGSGITMCTLLRSNPSILERLKARSACR